MTSQEAMVAKNGVIKLLFKALDMIICCHWFKQNKRERKHTTTLICTNRPEQKWECTVQRLSTRLRIQVTRPNRHMHTLLF